MNEQPQPYWSATDTVAKLAARDVSAVELVEAAIARIEALDGSLNAATRRADEAGPIFLRQPVTDGVQIMGPYLEDRTTLRFAELLEAECGGFVAPPGF